MLQLFNQRLSSNFYTVLYKLMKNFIVQIFPFTLLVVILISYGLFIPWLGFYLDDWYIVWFRHFFGSAAFADFFGQDRPFLAWIYIVLTPLFGDSPVAWQSFAVITRWVLSLAFWDLLKQIWPEKKFEADLGALLYSVFPAFKFHWFSVQYSQVYLIEAGMLFSLACSLRAIRDAKHTLRWLLTGLPFGIYALISVEYNFGLELLRPVIIWITLTQFNYKFWQRMMRTGLLWLPYFIPLVIFTFWRTFIFSPFQYDVILPNSTVNFSLKGLGSFILTVSKELMDSTINAWTAVFIPSNYSLSGMTLFFTIGITGFVFVFLGVFLFNLQKKIPSPRSLRWSWLVMSFGLLTVLLTMVPFKIGGLPVNLDFPWNRFMIAIGIGSVIFAVGFISLLPGNWLKVFVSTVLIAMSISNQINTANQFRLAWMDQKDFFWQLSWRIPGLKPNTVLVTDSFGTVQYYSGTSLSAPLNWIYAPLLSSRNTPYQLLMVDTPQFDESHTLLPDKEITIEYRSFSFQGHSNQSVFFLYDSIDCLQVLSETTITQRMLIDEHNSLFLQSVALSDLDLILVDSINPAQPPIALFGPEPAYNWCYYYLKADLARQQSDWDGTLTWYAKAEELGYTSLQDIEMYPKIEALAMTSNWEKARELTDELLAKDPFLNRGLCAVWERSVENNSPQDPDRGLAEELVELLHCPELFEVLR